MRSAATVAARTGRASTRSRPAAARSGRPAAARLPERAPPRAAAPGSAGVERLRPALAARVRPGRLLDALLYGRAWIAVVAVLLVGIVFFNVDLLQLNREIARTDKRALELKRANARLRSRLAELSSSERIQRAAAEQGFALPPPGEVRYVRADPGADPRLAARRIRPPLGLPAEVGVAPPTSGTVEAPTAAAVAP